MPLPEVPGEGGLSFVKTMLLRWRVGARAQYPSARRPHRQVIDGVVVWVDGRDYDGGGGRREERTVTVAPFALGPWLPLLYLDAPHVRGFGTGAEAASCHSYLPDSIPDGWKKWCESHSNIRGRRCMQTRVGALPVREHRAVKPAKSKTSVRASGKFGRPSTTDDSGSREADFAGKVFVGFNKAG